MKIFEYNNGDKFKHTYLGQIKILDRRYSDNQGIEYLIEHANPTRVECSWSSKGRNNYKAVVSEKFLMRLKKDFN